MTRTCTNCFAKEQRLFCRHKEISCCIYWLGQPENPYLAREGSDRPPEVSIGVKFVPARKYVVEKAIEAMRNDRVGANWENVFVKVCAAIRTQLES